jgi:hypothetical protein
MPVEADAQLVEMADNRRTVVQIMGHTVVGDVVAVVHLRLNVFRCSCDERLVEPGWRSRRRRS